MTIAILIIITLQSIGLFAFIELGWAKLPSGDFRWLATLVGGLMFGIGMGLAGSCSTGAYYRAAEGLVGSMVAVVGFVISSWYIRQPSGKQIFAPISAPSLPDASLTQTLNISPWIAVLALTLITLFLTYRYMNKKSFPIPQPKPRKTGISHLLFEARWHPFITAAIIGVIALLAWPSSLMSGRVGGLGISGPSAQLFSLITEGKTGFFGWAGYLLIGIFVGALVAAWGSQELRVRSPGWKALAKSLFGGLLMGIGSGLAGGCMLGNTVVNTAWFSWQGWLFIPCILLGSWLVSYFTIIIPNQLVKKSEA
ncbi:membrane protein [Leminorella grimontii]|uniref:Membrane protein n=3 Tax=Leminorella grimontii TaxID=82981 RepID=A0AAV5N1D4_9GAMM|nr:putative transport system permease protein [Leminorella grimontii ATCC 33999 = DSM 5078]GKX54934.1 membrane protein [Leminorella grimontii]